ncbi:MAG: hypothetical protein D3916_07400 [Candidatus Electrothrix sp. MAN1_4]|nr:hypothetical protein [Candidatus Electrothrix sp. MAN1_4]
MKKLLVLCSCMLLLTLTLTGCPNVPQPEDFPQTVELQPKASKKVTNNLTIRFNTVIGDSRCPTGTQCPWEGNAEILLELTGGGPETVHLNTGGMFPRTEVYNGYTITLQDLQPHPAAGVHIDESRYTAVLSVDLEKTEAPASTE